MRTANSTKATNPPISGQYMVLNIYEPGWTRADRCGGRPGRRVGSSGVQRDLLAGRGKRPGDLLAALLAKHEAQLAGRPQSLGPGRAEGRAGTGVRDRAQQVLMKEAVFALGLRGHSCWHTRPTPRSGWKHSRPSGDIKADLTPPHQPDSRKTLELRIRGNTCKLRGVRDPIGFAGAISVAFSEIA